MASSSDRKRVEDLRSLNRIGRDMYRKLSEDLSKEPFVCIAVMASWIFMEDLGYFNVIAMLLSCESDILNSAFSEAESLVRHIINKTPPPSSLIDMPITLRLIHSNGSREYISLNTLFEFEHGIITYIQIKKKIKALCDILFDDIFRKAMSGNNTTNTTVHSQRLSDEIGGSSFVTPPSERTMFVTFSKGYPITEDQVREYFVGMHGDCIERIDMQKAKPSKRQSMFAKIIFYNSRTIDEILGGEEKVRLFINGLHMQARRYEVREGSK
ncbi:hypothetical protein MKX01_032049 [Papaver californicum]|nr:hypothetical protein MKX01_032049 [Papaver californicum]